MGQDLRFNCGNNSRDDETSSSKTSKCFSNKTFHDKKQTNERAGSGQVMIILTNDKVDWWRGDKKLSVLRLEEFYCD